MIQHTTQANQLKLKLRESVSHEPLNSRPFKIAKHANVYTCADENQMVISSTGQVKILMLSPEGKNACSIPPTS